MSRVAWAAVAVILIIAVVLGCIEWGGRATAVAIVFGVLPDVALVGAFAGGGRLRPERVRFYNLCHAPALALLATLIGVVVLAATGGVGGGDWPIALAGIAWLAHIAVDRALGFGLRAPDGRIIPVGRATP